MSPRAYKRRRRWYWVGVYKRSKGCMICRYNLRGRVLQLDHREPSTKRDAVSRLISQDCSLKVIINEIRKCDVLCANCHAEKTHYGEYTHLTI
jgi:hypothetical protein